MKHIKTYESKQELDKINKIQSCKLSCLNFIQKIREIFYEHYHIILSAKNNINLQHNSVFNYVLGTKYAVFLSVDISSKYNISIHFLSGVKKDFNEFIDKFFNFEKDFKYYTCTNNELDEISNKIVDEFDMFINTKKYNL
jgi:hypothetical protein